MSPDGQPAPWAGTLTTTSINGKKVLAEPFHDRHRLGQFPGLYLQR